MIANTTAIVRATARPEIFSISAGYDVPVKASVDFPPRIFSKRPVDFILAYISIYIKAPTSPPKTKKKASFLPSPSAATPVPGQYAAIAQPQD